MSEVYLKKKFLNLSKEKLTIWAFGGSTTEGREPGCGHNTSSWVYELTKLNSIIGENVNIKDGAKLVIKTSSSELN